MSSSQSPIKKGALFRVESFLCSAMLMRNSTGTLVVGESDSVEDEAVPNVWRSNWQFILIQCILVFLIIRIQNIAVGVPLGTIAFLIWRRVWGNREAVVAIFILVCVLASSREPGLAYWKNLRLVPASLVFIEALIVFRTTSDSFRKSLSRFIPFVFFLTAPSAVLSDYVEEGLFESILLTSMWFSMLAVSRVEDKKSRLQRIATLKLLTAVVVLVSFGFFLLGGIDVFLSGRFRGVFGNPNELSHWLFPLVLVVCHSAEFSTPHEKRIFIIGALIILGLTGTRGALAALLIGTGGQLISRFRSFKTQFFGFVILGAVGLLLSTMTLERVMSFLPERLNRVDSIDEGGGRFLAWEYAIEEIKKAPFFGKGGGAEERYFISNYRFFALQNHEGLSHNSWLAFAMNFGVIQAILLILGLFVWLGLLHRKVLLSIAPALLLSLTVEGFLTAPMSSITPILFFAGGWLSFSR